MNANIVNSSNATVISKTVTDFVTQFKGYAKKTAEGVLQMARVVADAKKLGACDFEAFCAQIGYKSDSSTIRKLRSIGEKYEVLQARSKSLPTSWTTLYQVSRLTTEVIDQKINEGVINPSLDGKGLAARLGLADPATVKAVPNGTDPELAFSVNLALIPSPQMKLKLKSLIHDLENSMKATVTKSASLEAFLADPIDAVLRAA